MTLANYALDNTKARYALAATLARIYDQNVSRITEQITPGQLKAILANLDQCYTELAAQADWLHYASAYHPDHCCVREIYTEAKFRLTNLSILQPPPPPSPPAPAPERSLTDVINNFEAVTDTVLGEEEEGEDT